MGKVIGRDVSRKGYLRRIAAECDLTNDDVLPLVIAMSENRFRRFRRVTGRTDAFVNGDHDELPVTGHAA